MHHPSIVVVNQKEYSWKFVLAQNLESGILFSKKTVIELNFLRVGPPALKAKLIANHPLPLWTESFLSIRQFLKALGN